MSENPFFTHPILNSPYDYPGRHWELDETGQPTQKVIDTRRVAEFITPIPKSKRQKGGQKVFVYNEGEGISNEKQQYDPTPVINELRKHVDKWRSIENPAHWRVTQVSLCQQVFLPLC